MASDIATEVWAADFEENLFPQSNFMNKSVDHTGFVKDNIVHISQAGSPAGVVKNRTSLPASISERTDTDETYTLDEYSTDPILITNLDELQSRPDKRASVLHDHFEQLMARMGDETANSWGAAGLFSTGAGEIVLTTGAATASIAPPGGTGTRKAVQLADLANAASKLDEDDFSNDNKNRWMLMSARMYNNMLIENKAELLSTDFMNTGNLPEGVVRRIWGWNIIVRSRVNIYTNAGTPVLRAVGAATAADDNFGAVGWHTRAVSTARNAVKVFADNDVPQFYGDVLSAKVNHGSKILRTDRKGIVGIVQDT